MRGIHHDVSGLVFEEVFLDLPGILADSTVTVKLEGFNPAGSIKFKTALSLLESAERDGRLLAGGQVIESSSGNLGVALSVLCAQRGYHFTCVVDPTVNRQSIDYMRAMGADVVTVEERDGNGGFLGNRIRFIERRLLEVPSLVWVNQYASEANPEVHARLTAASILANVEDVDFLFVGVGTSGTMMGCAALFRDASPATRIIAVDSVGSVTFGGKAARRHIPGLGSSRRPEICDTSTPDDIVWVPELETIMECRELARKIGLLVGGSTGTVVRAIKMYAGNIPPGSKVVTISPDFGDRYLSTIYDDAWVESTYGCSLSDLETGTFATESVVA